MCLISIIIPVKNGEATLVKCLSAIKKQTISHNLEIIVMDSMSTDNSRKIAEDYGAKIISIHDGTFNHGLTRNLGVKCAKGELIYFTVQDAYLAEDDQLQKMAAHFEDEEVQSVTGIQGIPGDIDKNPAIWFKRFSEPVPEMKQFPEDSFLNLSPQKQLENCRWDNVNAMYRRTTLETLPFTKTDFAEDAIWARDALLRGWKIIRNSSLVVYHYHHQTFRYNFKTAFIINYTFWKHFKIMPAVSLNPKPFVRNVYTLVRKKQLSFDKKTGWIIHNGIRHIADATSIFVFRMAYLFGKQKLLDKAYNHFCSVIPQGTLQKKELSASA